jgi:hypothetical protein
MKSFQKFAEQRYSNEEIEELLSRYTKGMKELEKKVVWVPAEHDKAVRYYVYHELAQRDVRVSRNHEGKTVIDGSQNAIKLVRRFLKLLEQGHSPEDATAMLQKPKKVQEEPPEFDKTKTWKVGDIFKSGWQGHWYKITSIQKLKTTGEFAAWASRFHKKKGHVFGKSQPFVFGPEQPQPWQMPRGEFHQQRQGQDVQAINQEYWKSVEDALAAGEEVPSEIEAQYRQIKGFKEWCKMTGKKLS